MSVKEESLVRQAMRKRIPQYPFSALRAPRGPAVVGISGKMASYPRLVCDTC